MNGNRRTIVPLAAILACALIAAGCGDGDETTSTGTTTGGGTGAEQAIDSAIASCKDTAGQLGGVAGTALEGACTSVGQSAKQAASSGSEQVQQALSSAADSCRSTVNQLPSGQAQKALGKLCDAIAGAE